MIHIHKLLAIMDVKGRALLSKNFIIMPIFAIGFTFLMNTIYKSVTNGNMDMSFYSLAIGVVMNICMSGVYCVAASLAEEKEKKTLRTLMTSSVNGLEFFLGSLLPVLLMMIVVNIICVIVVKVPLSIEQWLAFLFVTTFASLIGCIIGMIFGIFAKNQMSAGTMTTPILMIFMLIPMLSSFNDVLEKISHFLFTGIVLETLARISENKSVIDIQQLMILILEAVVTMVIFLVLYKRNGFEANE